jgi:hypothetical protein
MTDSKSLFKTLALSLTSDQCNVTTLIQNNLVLGQALTFRVTPLSITFRRALRFSITSLDDH